MVLKPIGAVSPAAGTADGADIGAVSPAAGTLMVLLERSHQLQAQPMVLKPIGAVSPAAGTADGAETYWSGLTSRLKVMLGSRLGG